MDEISSILSEEVFITSKFFMAQKDMASGFSFKISKTFSSERYHPDEVEAVSQAWENILKLEILGRLIYKNAETDGNSNFSKVSLSFIKTDEYQVTLRDSEPILPTNTYRLFRFDAEFTAVEEIRIGSLLRI